jgi:signal transduction histidine kinase
LSIGTRLVIYLAVPLVLLMTLYGYLSQRQSRSLLDQELAREERAIARTVRWTMEAAVREGNLDKTIELFDQITGYEKVFGLRIFDQKGRLFYESGSLRPYPFGNADILARVLASRTHIETQVTVGREPAVAFIFPVSRPNGELFGAVEIVQVVAFLEEASRSSRNAIALLTLAMILATGPVILIVSALGVSRPIEDLVSSIRVVASGDLSARVTVRRRDEFGRLAEEFNRMGERLDATRRSLAEEQVRRRRTEDRLRDAERLASLGRLAAGLAHEIGNPLGVIGGRAEALKRKIPSNEEAERNLTIIASQIDRISRIVRGMLEFARVRELNLAPTDVPAVVGKVLEFLEPRIQELGILVEVDVKGDPGTIRADADRLQQVFLNLATNALDAMPRSGSLRVSIEVVPRADPGAQETMASYLSVAFSDTGPGIAAEHLPRIFDPFFTTKDVGKGTGLGLSIAYGITKDHGGFMEAGRDDGGGARVSVFLPMAS